MAKETQVTKPAEIQPIKGDPRAVAKQQIFAETVKAEMRSF